MTDYIAELDLWFPDFEVIEHVRKIIETEANCLIEFDEGPLQIPEDCKYQVISKALIKYYEGIAFGPCFRIVIAIGGVVKPSKGFCEAKFCFTTFWYSVKKRLITTDYSMNSPD